MTEYEYEYYSVSQKWPNTNTNIIRLSKKDRIRIRILFSFPKMTKYEYYSDSQKYIAEKSQTNANSVSMTICEVLWWKQSRSWTKVKMVKCFFFSSEMQLICSVHIMNPQIRQPAESDEQNLVLTNLTMTEMFNLLWIKVGAILFREHETRVSNGIHFDILLDLECTVVRWRRHLLFASNFSSQWSHWYS